MNIPGSLLARNTLLNLFGQGLPIVVAVVTVPIIIRGLGTERYGILAMAWVIISYFGIFDLGLGGAVTKFVAETLGKRAEKEVQRLIWTAMSFQVVLGAVGGLVLAVLTPLLLQRLLNIPTHLLGEARSSFYLLSFLGPLLLVSRTLNAVMEAMQRFDLVNAVRAPQTAVSTFLQLLGVLFGWGLPGIVALLLGCQTLVVVIQFYLCMQAFPRVMDCARPSLRELRTLLGFGRWVTISFILGPILDHLDRIAIGSLVTMSALAYYSVPQGIVNQLLIIPISFSTTLFPAFSTLSAQSQRERVGVLVSRSVKYLLLIVGPVVIILMASAREFLRLWLGADFANESATVLQILLVGVVINSLARIPFALIQAVGRPDLTAKFHLAEAPIHVLFVFGLVRMGGIEGAALAWTIRVAIDMLLLLVAACRLISLTPSDFLSDRVPQIAALLALVGSIALGVNGLTLAPELRLTLLAFTYLVGGVSVWRYSLNEGDRAEIARLLRVGGAR